MTRMLMTGLLAAALSAGAAHAEIHEVRMLNKDPEGGEVMVFEPAVIVIEKGDTVRFVAEDMGHNAVSQVVPDGGTEFVGKINEEIEVTFEEDGTWLYVCQPHLALGMVGLVLVGDHEVNIEEIEATELPGQKANERLAAYLDEAESVSTASAE